MAKRKAEAKGVGLAVRRQQLLQLTAMRLVYYAIRSVQDAEVCETGV